MKILRVIPTIDPHTGGPVEGLKRASTIMTELGVDVEILSLDRPDQHEEEAEKLPWAVHRQGANNRTYYGYSKHFQNWILEHASDYDAVIVHGTWQFHGRACSEACRRAKVPYFVYPHGMLDPWFNQAYPIKRLKKQIYWWLYEHNVLKNAESVLFTSEEECQLARKSFSPYKIKEHVIGYGTTAPNIDPDKLIRPEADWAKSPYFLFLGRIQEKKGLDLLVEAYSGLRANNPGIPNLVIAGPEQQPEYAQSIKEQFPQDGIHWIGTISGDLKSQALAHAEALTLVSHQENFGLVVAEALALGTPVMISNKVNIWREITHGGAGYAEDDTLDGAKILLKKWLSLNETEKETLRIQAKATFQKHFELRNATKRLIQLLEDTIKSR